VIPRSQGTRAAGARGISPGAAARRNHDSEKANSVKLTFGKNNLPSPPIRRKSRSARNPGGELQGKEIAIAFNRGTDRPLNALAEDEVSSS